MKLFEGETLVRYFVPYYDGATYGLWDKVTGQAYMPSGQGWDGGEIGEYPKCYVNESPINIVSIGNHAFEGCNSLTSIDIPNSVTSIGSSAFEGTTWYDNQPDGLVYAGKVAYKYKGSMPSRTNITLEEGTLGIAGGAFSGCSGMTSVTVPNSVTNIGEYAFYDCSSMSVVYCYAEQLPTISTSAFDNSDVEYAILYVPVVSLKSYKSTTPWSSFGTILPIVEHVSITGDANGNGVVEIGDVTSVLTLMATPEATGYDNKAADANGNGEIEIGDVTTTLTIMAKGE